MKRTVAVAFVVMFAITVGLGAYAADWGKAEIIHFWIAVPGGNVTGLVRMGYVSMAPVVVDLDQRGVLKNWLNPNIEAISTHWIYNYGQKPVRIQLEMTNLTIPVEWSVNANLPYDEETHTFTQYLYPGGSIKNLGIDWTFSIPDYYMDEQIIYQGALKIIDADTKETLTLIPIIIGHGQEIIAEVPNCCIG